MTAFDELMSHTIYLPSDNEWLVAEKVWQAALEHAAKICESKYGHYDGSQHNVYIDADECAEAIRKEISK